MIDVTFVVPVFNVENYIEECLDSIINQKGINKEILIINDGSTDNSREICEFYKKKYNYIKIIDKENGGLSSARNLGIKNSKGKYIFFIDSDDFLINEDSTALLYKICIRENLDIIRGFYTTYNDNERRLNENIINKYNYFEKVYCGIDFLHQEIKNATYEVIACMGLFKTDYLKNNNIYFKEGVTYEDHEFFLKCLLAEKSNRIMRTDNLIYAYRMRTGSITKTAKIKNIEDIISNMNSMKSFIKTKNLDINHQKIAKKTVSALFYQLTSVYGRLSSHERKKAYNLVPRKGKKELIYYSYNNYQKNKIIIFFYFKFLIDFVYECKKAKYSIIRYFIA